MEVNGSSRDEENQSCSYSVGEKEIVGHLIVECNYYESHRGRLIALVVLVIGKEEWARRLEEEDRAICMVLGQY